jgi:hypothetical protein
MVDVVLTETGEDVVGATVVGAARCAAGSFPLHAATMNMAADTNEATTFIAP